MLNDSTSVRDGRRVSDSTCAGVERAGLVNNGMGAGRGLVLSDSTSARAGPSE